MIRSIRKACLAASLLALSTAACAERQSAADRVADQVAGDRQPTPSDPKLAKDLEFLNACTDKRIRASDISYADSQSSITAKVRAVLQLCTDELYGDKR